MNPIRTIRRLTCILTGLAAALAAGGEPAAGSAGRRHPIRARGPRLQRRHR